MVTLDQVEKLKQRANVSYDEAKAALEKSEGDLLEAIINLEKENKIKGPEGGGFYSSKGQKTTDEEVSSAKNEKKDSKKNGTSFWELLGKFFRFCGRIISRGNKNHFEVIKKGERIITIPVTILVVLLIFAFWLIIPLLIVGLFFGYKYVFNGPDLGRESVNQAMNSVSKLANTIKNEVKGEDANGENTNS